MDIYEIISTMYSYTKLVLLIPKTMSLMLDTTNYSIISM